MTRKEALTELLAKVEAGDTPCRDEWNKVFQKTTTLDMCMVAQSEDDWRAIAAVKALHEAVLPGWFVRSLIQQGEEGIWHVSIWPELSVTVVDDQVIGKSDNPARAWLIAILKALIAECDE